MNRIRAAPLCVALLRIVPIPLYNIIFILAQCTIQLFFHLTSRCQNYLFYLLYFLAFTIVIIVKAFIEVGM